MLCLSCDRRVVFCPPDKRETWKWFSWSTKMQHVDSKSLPKALDVPVSRESPRGLVAGNSSGEEAAAAGPHPSGRTPQGWSGRRTCSGGAGCGACWRRRRTESRRSRCGAEEAKVGDHSAADRTGGGAGRDTNQCCVCGFVFIPTL